MQDFLIHWISMHEMALFSCCSLSASSVAGWMVLSGLSCSAGQCSAKGRDKIRRYSSGSTRRPSGNPTMTSIPSFFHPLIGQWFRETLGAPSDIQDRAWPIIAEGKHVLVTAPTGSGKTLTAFLWSLHQLITGSWSGGTVRVLYVSPLKALNNDVQRNLLRPLAELREVFLGNGEPFPDISVLTRSGDTPGEERRRMLRRPPEILITTPESLNLLLTSKSGRSMLTGVTVSIIDEVHAVVGNKRGTHLITALDRLVLLSGDFQRIALSATVNPLESVADFVGGYVRTESSNGSRYQRRPVSIIKSDQAKGYEMTVSFPAESAEITTSGSRWPSLIRAIKNIIAGHRSTLLFTNSRRTAEKVTRLINEGEPEELAYAHHGSLSRELRLAVEQKLKQGELKAIVATNSLELGIDIGTLDRVILVQTPRSVSSSVQRVGRSGHGVGEKSRGTIFPTHGRDFLDAAVMARAVIEQDIEAVHPVEAPLDILAQVVLSMTSSERWDIDELYAFLKTSYPFHTLSRRQYDSVLEMLNGRYSETRLRELKARVSIDRIDNTIEAQSGVPYLLYSSGGTIPDRGYFDLRLKENSSQDRRARRGVRVGAVRGGDLCPGFTALAHRQDHAQRRGGIAGSCCPGDISVLEGRGAAEGLSFLGQDRRFPRADRRPTRCLRFGTRAEGTLCNGCGRGQRAYRILKKAEAGNRDLPAPSSSCSDRICRRSCPQE